MQVFIDGRFYAPQDAKVSVFDHGFLYGNGVFTTLLATERGPLFIDDHLDRLCESARLVRIPVPWSRQQLRRWVIDTHEHNCHPPGRRRLRINISRGVGPDVPIDHARQCRPSLSIIASRCPEVSEQVARDGLRVCSIACERVLPRAKSFNFLPSVLALEEAHERGYDDALLVDRHGHVTEATTGNVFHFDQGVLHTPALGMLEGITRKHLIRIARELGLQVEEGCYGVAALQRADEVFLTGTTKLILPVTRIDGRAIAGGRFGECTLALKEAMAERLFPARPG